MHLSLFEGVQFRQHFKISLPRDLMCQRDRDIKRVASESQTNHWPL